LVVLGVFWPCSRGQLGASHGFGRRNRALQRYPTSPN